MFKFKYQFKFWKGAVLIAIFVATAVAPIVLTKLPRLIDKLPYTLEAIERSLKFGLAPSSVVKAEHNLVAQPLKPLRAPHTNGPLRVSSANSRYFADRTGKVVYLTGAHTWANLQDSGRTDPPSTFDYGKYLDFLDSYHHNFFKLYVWEQARWTAEATDDYWITPMPYARSGKEKALDGKPKFDLTQFNQAYFDRLRQRVAEAQQRGMYVSIMLFSGWGIEGKGTPGNPWPGHPYHRDNNINGIDGDPNRNGRGEETHTLEIPAVTALQEAYVRKVIDTVNDFDNTLYEISNESHGRSTQWQYHLIDYIKKYELNKPNQHPVGMTVEYPESDNSKLFASQADWISPAGDIERPSTADGQKVIISDTDHICGICGDRAWVWKTFTKGGNPIFMDAYDGAVLVAPTIPADPLNYEPWVSIRRNLGYTLAYANQLNLAEMKPEPTLASTGYCLAKPSSPGAEYLVYLPKGGTAKVDLSATKGNLLVEWFDPNRGLVFDGTRTVGGGNRSFVAPFEGDAVLYIKEI